VQVTDRPATLSSIDLPLFSELQTRSFHASIYPWNDFDMAMEASQNAYVDAYMAKKGPAIAKMHPSWSYFDAESRRGIEAKHR